MSLLKITTIIKLNTLYFTGTETGNYKALDTKKL
jgi:hypothetical protein